MVGLLEFVKEEIKKVPYKLHWQEVSARLEMSQKRKPLAKARALFYNGLKEAGRNKSKINVVCRHFRSVSLWEVQWLQNTLLKEKVLREKAGISNLILLTRSVQILVEPFSMQLSNQADARVAFSDSILTARLTPGSSDISTIKEKLLGPAHACTHSPTILSIQETKSWDMPNLELPGYVCHGSKSGFATLLVSEQFGTITRSWKFEERCTAILFGTTLVMAVHAPGSSKSLEMYEACISSVIKVLREGRRVVQRTRT